MEPLPTLAAVPGQTPGAQPRISLAAPLASTGGLFEREVERALERQDAAGGDRVAESRASAIQERRTQRRASFERGGSEEKLQPRDASDPEATHALVDSTAPRPGEATSTGRNDS